LFYHAINPEEADAGYVAYLYGEASKDRVHIVGCVACRSSDPPSKNGYPGIPDWRNEQVELSSVIPNGKNKLC